MTNSIELITACVVIGLGVASSLYRRHFLALIVSLSSAVIGLVLAFSAVEGAMPSSGREGSLFAYLVAVFIFLWSGIGCAVVWRRFMSAKTPYIDESLELKN